ncbi:MAG: PQQ-binding-like beta-propeller repeat protein [Deltaproteobacteria bacterium]|nr:PQQ-binding-like beta-propeller repeat protein [Deltaproteobacteria bacterium]
MPRQSSKKRFPDFVSLLFVCIVSGCALQPAPAGYKPWGTHLADDGRSNYSEGKFTPPVHLSWYVYLPSHDYFSPGERIEPSAPVMSKGTIYAAASEGKLYAFNASTSKLLWIYDAKYPVEATPTVEEDAVCFGSSDGVLRCIGAKDGKLLWKFQARSSVLSSPVIKNDTVYFHASDDRVWALALKTGEKKWVYNRGAYQTVAPRLTSSSAYGGIPPLGNGFLYTLFSDGFVACIDAGTGKEVWGKRVIANFDSPSKTRRTPLVSADSVYLIDADNAVIALDAATGETKKTYNVIKAYDFVLHDGRIPPFARTVILAGQEMLVSVDAVTGAVVWKKELSKKPLSSIFAAGDFVFAVSNYVHNPLGMESLSSTKGYVEAFRLSNGEAAWSAEIDDSVGGNAAAEGNAIALMTNNGALSVLGSNGCFLCRKMLPDNE